MTTDLERRGIGDEEIQGPGGRGVGWDVQVTQGSGQRQVEKGALSEAGGR